MEPQADTIDRDILDALRDISDPEIGVSIVDLGLVYCAERTGAGIRIAMTMTTPSCPVSDMLIGDVRDALHRRFLDTRRAPGWWGGGPRRGRQRAGATRRAASSAGARGPRASPRRRGPAACSAASRGTRQRRDRAGSTHRVADAPVAPDS